MRLRNKKTGEVKDCVLMPNDINDDEVICNSSLAKLNAEWEDYEPADPLIKDPKVRKAVRAWAEANGTSKLTFDGYYMLTDEQMNDIEFGTTKPFEELEKGICYTIEELCREEEE
jgi:hypothetical protein